MEEKENLGSGFALKGDKAPDSYQVAKRSENPNPIVVPTVAATAAAAAEPVADAVSPASVAVTATATATATATDGKKKRGRPRKYDTNGKVVLALSPMPISASIPLTGEYSAWKRGRGKPSESVKKSHKFVFGTPGEKIAYSVGANFTPHMITVNPGEDVTMKIMSFSQQGSRAICILTANGTISSVTLRQPTTSGGTLTYEGLFEILSLSGSFMLTENGGTKSRSGGMSVSLAGPDGRVVGGGLSGLLVAASSVQVVIGSFMPGHQQENKPKQHRIDFTTNAISPQINSANGDELKGIYSGVKPIVTPASYLEDNSVSLFRISSIDNKSSLPEGDPIKL